MVLPEGDPILDQGASSMGHTGPWGGDLMCFNMAFELMTVPEPATLSLLALGGLALLRRRRQA